MMAITVVVELSIAKPADTVFQTLLSPVPFFLKAASEPLSAGKEVLWEFAELAKRFPVRVRKIEAGKLIQFDWMRGEGDAMNSVEIVFKPFSETVTTVFISESGWPDNEEGRAASTRNCMGWTHMLCSLKAFLEYGINLREGSFVHMKFD